MRSICLAGHGLVIDIFDSAFVQLLQRLNYFNNQS